MSITRRAARVPVASLACLLVTSFGVAAEEPVLPAVPLAAAAPVVDGDLSDPVWKKALLLKIDGFCDGARRKKGLKPTDATEALVAADKDNLYVGFRSRESHADGPWIYRNDRLKRRKNSHVMGGDYVALAIDMGRFGFYNYYMFFVNPSGELYQCFTWPHRYDLVLRDVALPQTKAAARIDKAGKVWTAELKIPLKGLLRYPADGFPSVVGLDLRRLQWGADRGKQELEIYWTGMANVTKNRIRPQYDHMATWKPLFETYPDYRGAYAAGRGWVQLVFPESFGHVRLASGTIDNKLVVGEGKRLTGHIWTRAPSPGRARARVTKMLDAPRMEYWADVRPPRKPAGPPKVVVTAPPGGAARFTEKPRTEIKADGTRISFAVSAATDVAVAVVDAQGKTIRHLAAGVLGPNAPEPLAKDRLKQTLTWDHADDFGRPVKPGQYKVTVSLGLKPRFHLAIPIDRKNRFYRDSTPTSKGLDVENLPNPKLGKTLGHFAWGSANYLSVDRDREEVYVQTQYVYDGRTGKKLRDLKFYGPRIPNVSQPPPSGEIFPARRDGLLYVTGPNEVWRFDRRGKPAPFEAVGRNFIPELWGAHANPHRGVCVGLDGDIYKMHHYTPHAAMTNQITRISPAGRIKSYGFIEIDALAAGVRVDRRGNVYVGCTIQPPDALPPEPLASKMPAKPRRLFKRVYGSIVKFGPEGGVIKPDPAGKLMSPGPKGPRPFVARGAKWVHPGFSPMLSRISDSSGGPGCSCRNGRFDLDDFGRLFIPDAVSGRVEIIDSNANTIAFVGRRGKAEAASGVEFGWPTQVAVSDEAVYVADYLRFRVVRVILEYAAQAATVVAVK